MVKVWQFVLAGSEDFCEQITLGPDNAMYRLTRGAPYGANGKALWCFFGVTVVTLAFALL